MSESLYPAATKALADRRKALAPKCEDAFKVFSQQVFANSALPTKTKQLIAVAVAHVTQCPYCIRGHTKPARRQGATPEEIMEAIWVAAEMRAGAAYAHAAIALDAMKDRVMEKRIGAGMPRAPSVGCILGSVPGTARVRYLDWPGFWKHLRDLERKSRR